MTSRSWLFLFLSPWLALLAPVGDLAAQTPSAAARDTRRLSADEAVKLALEHNLGVRAARLGPQVQDLSVAQFLAAWNPAFTSSVAGSSTDTPISSFLMGPLGSKNTDRQLTSNVGFRQNLRRGGSSYSIGWDNSRATTTNVFANFSPQTNSSLSLSFVQPLLRNFAIDSSRQQLEVGRKNRDISDLELETSVVTTTRSVRHAYWDLAYAIETLTVQKQSLDLARESLRNTRSRVEIGTQAPIDVVEAEAEVAQRDEAVIVAEAAIERAEDALRTLILDPAAPDFWTTKLEPTDRPPFSPLKVDVESAVQRAIEQRTDLQQTRKTLEANDISIRFFRNQTLPEVTAQVDYGLIGVGGTQALRGDGFPGPIIGRSTRGFGTVLGDVFGNNFPRWTAALNISYPIGHTQQEANLARARLQQSQSQIQLRNQQVQVTSQVRDAARTLQTNQKRVASTTASRQLAERKLEAEQKKIAAGQSTSFFVFQAQRDLAQAQNNELRAILDYNKSVVDFDTVQQVPLGGAGAAVAAIPASAGGTAPGAGGAASSAAGGGMNPQQQRGF